MVVMLKQGTYFLSLLYYCHNWNALGNEFTENIAYFNDKISKIFHKVNSKLVLLNNNCL